MKPSCLVFLLLLVAAGAVAQTNCNEGGGPLDAALPSTPSTAEIVRKFSENEARFKQARTGYSYTQDITIQTLIDMRLGRTAVSGEFRLVSQITYDSQGNRMEKVSFAPQTSLHSISVTREDFDDIQALAGFTLTPDELPLYDLRYAGRQHVDEIETYVFDVSPKHIKKDQRYFEGRAWIDVHDFALVKTCGKRIPDRRDKRQENLSPKFVTYREQFDGQYWFPTYSRADDVLRFARSAVHVREIVKYTKYERSASAIAVKSEGKAGENAGTAPQAQPVKKP